LLVAVLLIAHGAQFDRLTPTDDRPSLQNAFPSFPQPGKRLDISNELPALSAAEQERIESVVLFGDPGRKALKSILEVPLFPHLKSLQLMVPITVEELRQLSQLPELESLTLLISQGLTADELSLLADCRQLTTLKVIEATGYDQAKGEIRWPATLRQLSLKGPRGLPLARLQELQQLPHLQTLEMRLDPVHPTSRLPDEVIATLNRFPALQRIYLQEMNQLYPELVVQAQRNLPGITLRPSAYDSRRLMMVQVTMVTFGSWLCLILVQLSAQCVGSAAVMLPRYHRAHLGIAGGVLLFAMLVCGILLWRQGVSLMGGVGVFGFATTFVWLMTRLYRTSEAAVPGLTQPFLAFPIVMFLTLTGLVAIGFRGSHLDWLLRGHLPLWCAVPAGVAIYGLYDMARWMIELPRLVEASNRGGVPLGTLDMKGWQEWQLRSLKAPSRKLTAWQEFLTGANRRLEAELSKPRSVQNRRRLWIASEQMSLVRSTGNTTFIATVFVVGMGYWNDEIRNDVRAWIRISGGLVCYILMLTTMFPLLLLFQRHQTLSSELLRPVSRHDWIRDWYRISAVRMLPAVLGSALLIVLAWCADLIAFRSAINVAAAVALCAAAWFLIYGVGMWLISYRWTPYALVCTFPLFMMMIVAVATGPLQPLIADWFSSSLSLWLTALGLFALGALSLRQAYRRWWNWELAR